MLDKLRQQFYQALSLYFQSAKVDLTERRGVIVEIRAVIAEGTFIEVYANVITGKRSYALISYSNRITGYDNYKFWHCHPPDAPSEHLPCDEPSIDSVLLNFKEILDKTDSMTADNSVLEPK